MKTALKFLALTTIMVIGANYYFEYFINREMPFWITSIVTFFAIATFLAYVIYLVRLLHKLLNLK